MELFKNIIASSTTISLSVMVFNPLDCLRIRWQVNNHSEFRNHLNRIIKNEGILKGLYKPGIAANMIGSGVSRGIGMGFYPLIRDNLFEKKTYYSMFISGLISGALGYFLSNPFWIVKTRLQADKELKKYNYKNTFNSLEKIYDRGNVKNLYKGSLLLALRGSFMNAGNTLGYDGTKSLFTPLEFSNEH